MGDTDTILFSIDASRIFVGGKILSTVEGSLLAHIPRARALSGLDDGSRFLSSDLQICDLSTQKPRTTAIRARSPLEKAAICPNRPIVATVHWNSIRNISGFQLWSTNTGEALSPLLEISGQIERLNFARDGNSLTIFAADYFWTLPLSPTTQSIEELLAIATATSGKVIDEFGSLIDSDITNAIRILNTADAKSVKISIDERRRYFLQAIAAAKKSGNSSAIQWGLEQILKLKPTVTAVDGLGKLALEQQDWKLAESRFTEEIGVVDGNGDAWLGRARARIFLGLLDAARSDLENAEERTFLSDTREYWKLAAIIEAESGNPEAALTCLQRVSSLFFENWEEVEQDWRGDIHDLMEAGRWNAVDLILTSLLELSTGSAGYADYARNLDPIDDRLAHWYRAQVRMRLRRWHEAIDDLNSAVNLWPQAAATACRLKGICQAELGNWQPAAHEFEQLFKLSVQPLDVGDYRNHFLTLVASGDEAAASQVLSKLTDRVTEKKTPENLLEYLRVSIIRPSNSERLKVLEWFTELPKNDPLLPSLRAVILFRMGQIDQARELLQELDRTAQESTFSLFIQKAVITLISIRTGDKIAAQAHIDELKKLQIQLRSDESADWRDKLEAELLIEEILKT